ncbi:MAG: TetR/AcrR family transcriptional regulator [Novosphingobium sp.]
MATAAAQTGKTRDARQLRSDAALRAALIALIPRQTYDKITVRDIVAEAGVGYATFFRHYPSKDAMLDAIASDELAEMLARTAPLLDPLDTRKTCVVLAQHVGSRRDVWSALLTGGAATHLRQQFERLADNVSSATYPTDWLPRELGIRFGVTATIEILGWWLCERPDYPLDDVAELLDRLTIAPTVGALKRA